MNTHKCIDTIDTNTNTNALPVKLALTWQGWVLDGKRLMRAEIQATFPTLILWRHRSASRHQLSKLENFQLKDIGLTRQQARLEFQKPFWKA